MGIVTTLTESCQAFLVDVSATGACIRGDGLPGQGEELFITIESVIAFGDVVWALGDLRGIAFETPLTAENELHLRALIAQSRGVAPEIRAAMEDWALGLSR